MSRHTGRTTRRFRTLAANLRARRNPCSLCGQPINYTLHNPDPMSFSVEHIKPWATHPHLREDPSNLAAAHLRCNQRGRSIIHEQQQHDELLGDTSRDW